MGRNRWQRYGSGLRATVGFSTVGLELAFSILIGYLAGDWLDGKLGTAPWLTLILMGVGIGAGFLSLHRAMKRLMRAGEEPRNDKGGT